MKYHAEKTGSTCRLKCLLIGLFLLCLPFQGCDRQREVLIAGETMGTTYHIKVVVKKSGDVKTIENRIDEKLKAINHSMSLYDDTSEISRFNRLDDTEKTLAVSEAFYTVMMTAKKLFDLTGGAWDGTLAPLIDLWGFGPSAHPAVVPGKTAIAAALDAVGFDRIDLSERNHLRKKHPSISVDLNSIAKGYAVDRVAGLLREMGFQHFLVEIGGEMVASGIKSDGGSWRVGVNLPRTDAGYNEVYQILELTDKALATSGDYRNFFELEGVRYAHVFDPRTGYPVSNGVVSVTIMADTCAFADGLATALMVMGREKGLALINTLENVEGLMIVEGENHRLENYVSTGFQTIKVPDTARP